MDRFAVILHVAFYLAVLVAETCTSSSWAREILYRPKRQVKCERSNQFRCTSGECIDSFSVCDGTKECSDGADETESICKQLNIKCPSPLTFQCAYGACIDGNKKCNGVTDCADDSDEKPSACTTSASSATGSAPSNCKNDEEFECKSGQCIDEFSVCDGKMNCDDGSDETTALCANINTLPETREGCRLPQQPKSGSYTAPACEHSNINCSQIPGSLVPQNWLLSFKCNDGYYINGTNEDKVSRFCNNGKWSDTIPVCRKMCSPLISLSVDVTCWYQGESVDCSKPMRSGTQAIGHCKQLYEVIQTPPYKEIICREYGQWSYELFYCQPVCGKRNFQDAITPLIINGQSTKHGEFPWHAGLYIKNTSNLWEQKCGGSLISPHIVLTAANCVYNETEEKILSPTDVKVGLGKYHREWTHDEPNAIKTDVQKILIPPRYSGRRTSYALNIALLDLSYSIQISTSVMPVCVDWNLQFMIKPGMSGTLTGSGGTENGTSSDVLLYAELPYIDYRHCLLDVLPLYQKYVTPDKFCAGFTNGSGAARGDGGGGLTFLHNDLHYVYGIVSTIVKGADSLMTFTNVSDTELHAWLNDTRKELDREHPETCSDYSFRCSSGGCVDAAARCNGTKECADNSDEDTGVCKHPEAPSTATPVTSVTLPETREGCRLPQQPESGSYIAPACEHSNSNCSQIPGSLVPQNWLLSFKCIDGYYINGTNEDKVFRFCNNGKWSDTIPVCRKMCPPLISLSVDVTCWYQGESVDCSKPMRPGTRASGHCKQSYEQIRPPPYKEIICREYGQWSYELFYCQPVCGKRNFQDAITPLIINGQSTKHGEFPWHAGLYIKNTSNLWEQKCGGSLISPHIVLTAAHCVYDETNKNIRSPTDVKVGLGKYYREWTHDEPNAIKKDVRKILIPPRYYGRSGNYAHDIALLDLNYSIQISTRVMPVCVDWNLQFMITPGMSGTLAGWGKTDNGTPSDVLLYTELPYIDFRHCLLHDVLPKYRHYLTFDKFCASFTNGSGAAEGDSGGGLTFLHNDLHYVYGIVSTRINSNSLITFTNVSDTQLHAWLNNAKNEFDREHPEI